MQSLNYCPVCAMGNFWHLGHIIESLRLEKTSKIIRSNCQPNTTMPDKPCPEVPHLHVFWTPPDLSGMLLGNFTMAAF